MHRALIVGLVLVSVSFSAPFAGGYLFTNMDHAHFGHASFERPVDPWQFPGLADSKPFQRWWWAFQQRAYPLGYIPEDALLHAFEQITLSKAGPTLASQPNWVNVGPAPIQTPWGPWSGAVMDVAVNPRDPNQWMIATATGGVWETRNAGLNWAPKTDDQASLATGSIAFAPSNPSVIYAGTGNIIPIAFAGQGLLKSTDGGTTWQHLASATFSGATFVGIKVHPSNPDILLAGTATGLAGRGGSFLPREPPPGIYKSTDGGLNWTRKVHGYASDIEIHPADFSNQYAGLGTYFNIRRDPNVPNGVYRSTDLGETWTLIAGPWTALSGGVGRVEVAIAPSNPNVLYVSIVDAVDNVGNDGQLLGIWRTDTAWASTPSWTQIPSPDSSQWWYTNKLIVEPNNPNILYAGGTRLWKFDGTRWTNILQNVHLDQHAMVWVGNRLVVGNDGGVYSTTDGGTTWTNNNGNLSITQFYDGSMHPTNPNFALGGSQDNGVAKWTGSNAWQFVFGGDGADNEISSRSPDTHWAISYQELSIIRTTDGGTSFTKADTGIDKTGNPFIAFFAKCPADDDVFIAGTDNLWKSTNFFSASTASWSSNSPEMRAPITALTFAPSDTTCNTYGFGTSDGQLRLTTNGGITWTEIDPGNAVPNRWVTDLAFDPHDSNILYVTLSGFDEGTPNHPGHVFKTTNALAPSPTWSNVSPPVNIPNDTIALDPSDPKIVYVGTDVGIWKSTNAGSTWIHKGPETGLPNVFVFDLQINSEVLIAFTHGRGAFKVSISNKPDFSVACSPSSLSIRQGEKGESRCTVTSMNEFNSAVALSCSSVPPHVTCAFNPSSVTPPHDGTFDTILTLNVDLSVTLDNYTLQVIGTSEGKARPFNVQLSVAAMDTVQPVTAASLAGTPGDGGWYVSAVTVSISATDTLSGVASVQYRVDGSAWQTYASPFSISTDGAHLVEYFAIDNVGNQEAVKSVTVRVDRSPPAVKANASGTAGSAGWYRSAVTVTLSAADSASGVAILEYRIDGGAWAAYAAPLTLSLEGSHLVDSRATDVAGNMALTQQLSVKIDVTKPTIAITAPASDATLTSTTVTVSGTASDNVAVEKIEISADGTTWITATGTTSWSGTLTLGDGARTIHARATDTAGNTVTASVAVTVELTPPPFALIVAGVASVAVIAVAAVGGLLWRRRRRSRTPPP